MVLPEQPAGWVALGIGLAIWAFAILGVILAFKSDMDDEKKKNQSSIHLIYYGPCPGGAKNTPF